MEKEMSERERERIANMSVLNNNTVSEFNVFFFCFFLKMARVRPEL